MFWLTPITRAPAQGSPCKDLGRNDQSPAITPKAAYTPIPNRSGSRSPYKKSPLSIPKELFSGTPSHQLLFKRPSIRQGKWFTWQQCDRG